MTGGDRDAASDLREFGRSAVNTVLDRMGRGVSKVQERTPLAYDLLESPDAYLVVFDAPGATDSDLQVRFRRGAVEVRIDRFREFHEGFDTRFPGRGLSLDGRADLPADVAVDPEGATATLSERGTLHVRIPKAEESHPVAVGESDEATDDDPERIGIDEDADEAALSGDADAAARSGADANDETDESALSDERDDGGDGRGEDGAADDEE